MNSNFYESNQFGQQANNFSNGNGNNANPFAMDVSLNSFQSFSQTPQQQQLQQGGGGGGGGGPRKPFFRNNNQQRPFNNSKNQSKDDDDDKDALNKVFIGGIHYDTTDDGLRDYFAKFGTITDYVIIKDPQTKRSRGFGFVKYTESTMVDEVMKNRPHVIDSKRLDVKRSTPRKDAVKMESSANVNKFVNNYSFIHC
jgi:RNA recognition motif-containing protein